MSSLNRHVRRLPRVKSSIATILIIWMMASPLAPTHAKLVGEEARKAPDLIKTAGSRGGKTSSTRPPRAEADSPSERAAQTQHIRLCPRKLSLHMEEAYTLVPVPLDQNRQTIQGAQMTWSSNNPSVASVTSYGEVEAKSPGHAVLTVQIGNQRANVTVEAEAGVGLRISDSEWDQRHAHDCDDPEAAQLNEPYPQGRQDDRLIVAGWIRSYKPDTQPATVSQAAQYAGEESAVSRFGPKRASGVATGTGMVLDKAKYAVRPAVQPSTVLQANRPIRNSLRVTPSLASTSVTRPRPVFQGEIPDLFFPEATTIGNAIGSPRFSPVEEPHVNSIKTRNNLGSSNYGFAAPILGLGGRDINVNLILNYNAQLWGKDSSGAPTKMVFDYNKVGPAPGWSAGYGRLMPNYDNTATGNGSSDGSANAPGNYLLILSDGTRIQLQQRYDPNTDKWYHTSSDGLFTSFNPRTQRLRYSDGTLIRYSSVNNRLLPTSIKSRNGDLIVIDYRQHDSTTFPNRFAISQITDSLGRIIRFYYYGDPEYPSGPLAKLAAITAPDQGGNTRTLIRLEYQTVTLQYNFRSTYAIDGPANNTPLTVVSRVYYPATGRGYLFLDYSSYGMCRYISERKDMTGPSGITDGTESAYTKYNFVDINTQVGQLTDTPQYTERREWWQDKSDGSTASLYTYSRVKGDPEVDTVTEPLTNLEMVTTSAGGQVTSVESKSGTTVLRRVGYFYDVFNPSQLSGILTTDEAGNTSGVSYEYGSYNRVTNTYESDFSGATVRRTRYQYSDAQAYLDLNILRLVTQVAVFDGPSGAMKQKTNFTYDDYAAKGGMEYYGLTPSTYPPYHDSDFNQNYTTRGNVTGVEAFSSISPNVALPIKYNKYDVFGNVIEADVSCCKVKTASFGWSTVFSQPDSATDGKSGVVPYLTTSYQYDFNTGLVTQATDPNGQTSTFFYDSAWRLLTVNAPSGASTTTRLDKDANGNDQLAYTQQASYKEKDTDSSPKVITSKSWFDGAGRVIRSGSGAGASPTSFDTVAMQYDSIGRMLKQSNPYVGDSSGNGSPAFWTTNVYDLLSRVKEVDLPDDQPAGQRSRILTDYNGAVVTVTDQVGRQRQSEVDGLGRLIKVTEQNPATGLLDATNYQTTYTYDALDNLTGVNQGGQTRSFVYDALNRTTTETTPEGGTVTFTYTDFSAVLKRTHTARGVEEHHAYDSLNRLTQVWYTGLGGNDSGTIRPALPSGVAPTADVVVAYNTAAPGNGQISRVDDGGGFETYGYDALGRTTSKTRTIDAVNSYPTQSQYNQANQLRLLIYPSGKRVRMNFDARGRLSGEDKVDAAEAVLTTYASGIGYNVASQVTGLTLGNGVAESYTYSSSRLQMTRQTATKSGNPLMDLNYNYAAAAGASGAGTTAGNSGQLMAIATGSTVNGQARPESYSYDDLGRLASAAGYYAQRNYSYDRWGNRTAVSGGVAQTVTLQQSGGVPNNRIATVNGVSYSYDAAGNLTGDGVHTYQYDAAGRIASVDNTAASYSYDAGNRRVKKVVGSGASAVTTYSIWEGGRVIAEYSNAQAGTGGVKYYLADRLSTRLVMDSSGAVIGTQDHVPYGEDAGTSTGQTEKHRFTSYERDTESGTDYAVNRQYAMATGRFMRPDPIHGSRANPQSLNRYGYVGNDPVNATDPQGLDYISPGDGAGYPNLGTISVSAGLQIIIEAENWAQLQALSNSSIALPIVNTSIKVLIDLLLVQTPVTSQSDCSKFVDALMQFTNKPMIKTTHALIGVKMALDAKNRLGPQANELGYSGFKEELIAGGQNGWAMVHIQGIAGAVLAGSQSTIDKQFNEDRAQLKIGLDFKAMGWKTLEYAKDPKYPIDKYIAEKQAEIADDYAGLDVGSALWNKISGRWAWSKTRIEIFNRICK